MEQDKTADGAARETKELDNGFEVWNIGNNINIDLQIFAATRFTFRDVHPATELAGGVQELPKRDCSFT